MTGHIETVVAWRTAIDRLEQEDPEFAALYRSVAERRDPSERPGEWDSLGPASDAEPPVRPGETWPRSGRSRNRPGPDERDLGRW